MLHVGCGAGALTAALFEMLGADRVTAIDPSKPFVEACARRLPGADVRAGSAEALPFPDHSFDVTLARLVVNFMSDPRAGVGEMRRVTRPGGTVGAAVWDYADEMTLLGPCSWVDLALRHRRWRVGDCRRLKRRPSTIRHDR